MIEKKSGPLSRHIMKVVTVTRSERRYRQVLEYVAQEKLAQSVTSFSDGSSSFVILFITTRNTFVRLLEFLATLNLPIKEEIERIDTWQ